MALTHSSMLPLGTAIPTFELTEVTSDKILSSEALFGPKGLVVMFICVHCPYVIHVEPMLVTIAKEYQTKGIEFVAISSNDIMAYPKDAPEHMIQQAAKAGFTFPYLFDPSQQIARAFHAECTPDFYLFNEQRKCVYRGRMDASTPGNGLLITGNDLCAAMDNLLQGISISETQFPSMGCNIKWTHG